MADLRLALTSRPTARLAAKAPRKPADYGNWVRRKMAGCARRRIFFVEYASKECPWVVVLRFKAGQLPSSPVTIEVKSARPGAGAAPDALRWGRGPNVPVRDGEAVIAYAQLRKWLPSLGRVTIIWNR